MYAFKRQKVGAEGCWYGTSSSYEADPDPHQPVQARDGNSYSNFTPTPTPTPASFTFAHATSELEAAPPHSPKPSLSPYPSQVAHFEPSRDSYSWLNHSHNEPEPEPEPEPQTASSRENDEFAQVCFGMFVISGLKTSKRQSQHTSFDPFPVEVSSGSIYRASDHASPPGNAQSSTELVQISSSRAADVLHKLEEAEDVELEYYCRGVPSLSRRNKSQQTQVKEYELLINVFGKSELCEQFGTFFEKLDVYLQDPLACKRDVPYRNPHLMAQADIVIMTSSLRSKPGLENFTTPADIFDKLLDTGVLPEAECPTMLQTRLLSHQKQALYFMRKREQTSNMGCSPDHMWTQEKSTEAVFTNNITGERQTSRPQDSFGGIIADHMGLGKTLQMISLLASDHDHPGQMQRCNQKRANAGSDPQYCSLVILPVSLLQTWENQLKEHLRPNSLRWCVYHGERRKLALGLTPGCHIVLTTYDVVVSEYQKTFDPNSSMFSSPIFSWTWTRIILDEAHYIKNLSALRTKAVCAVKARARWAVTGTPIQNRLGDLAALIHFLQVDPFHRPGVFDAHIVQPWKSRSDPRAVQKLKRLIASIAIRRSKGMLSLPDRVDQIRHVEFNATEWNSYEKLHSRIRSNILGSVDKPHILCWIDDLRAFCSHGQINMSTKDSHNMKDFAAEEFPGSNTGLMIAPDPMYDDLGTDLHGTNSSCLGTSDLDSYGSLGCFETYPPGEPGPSWQPEYQRSRDPQSGLLSPHTMDSTPSILSPELNESGPVSTSKIESLMFDLCAHDGKAVVFSFWRRSLDQVARSLNDIGIPYRRIDGKVATKERDQILNTFRTDPNILVLLATISTAGVGLDITVANLACILEPQWNPSVEEQALSRVHRMRQTKPVKTIRYVVSNSIEENIIKLQQRKRKLAEVALSGCSEAGGAIEKIQMEDLKFLLK